MCGDREDARVPGHVSRADGRAVAAAGHRTGRSEDQGTARRASATGVDEVILATNPNVEGEATAIYLARLLKPLGVTRDAHRDGRAGGQRPRVRRRSDDAQVDGRPARGSRST